MKTTSKDFRKILEGIAHNHDIHTVFCAFARLAACALAVQTRESEYFTEAKHWKNDELLAFSHALGALVSEMQEQPYTDLLGRYYMEFAISAGGQKWNGEFHTPRSICELMARLALGDLAELPAEGPITVCEPACGAGAMVLAFAHAVPVEHRRRLRVTAIDINRTACNMCFINTSLWGIPTRVVHGNTLSVKTWTAWDNLHWIMPCTSHSRALQGCIKPRLGVSNHPQKRAIGATPGRFSPPQCLKPHFATHWQRKSLISGLFS